MRIMTPLLCVWLIMPAALRADAPNVTRLEIQPGTRVVAAPPKTQQLAAIAHFSDGARRNVTRLTVFTSSHPQAATIDEKGLVTFHQPGEVAVLCRYLTTTEMIRLTHVDARPGYRWPEPAEANYIDRHVFARLKQLRIAPSDLCTDAEFLRRASLDACGILPTPAEVRKFLADLDKNKRAKLIDRLLETSEYVDFWTFQWVEDLNVSTTLLGDKSALAYQAWIRAQVNKNTPVDAFVRDLLTAQGDSVKVGPANFYRTYRDPAHLAEQTAGLFLGIRLECVACHPHYSAPWTQDDHNGFAAFFAQVGRNTPNGKRWEAETIAIERKEEWLDPQSRQIVPAKFLGGAVRQFKAGEDRRAVLAGWLTAPDNSFFAKAFVNNVWSKMFGKGIVEPINDFRPSNPSANDALLDALATDFVAHRYDLKRLVRTMMQSRTYQLSGKENNHNKTDERYFSRRIHVPLNDVVIFDAIAAALDEPYKFQGKPAGTRRVQVLDSELFFSTTPVLGLHRMTSCGREPLPQVQLGSPWSLIEGRLDSKKSRVARLQTMKLSDKEIIEELCLATLSRLPDEKLEKVALDYVQREGQDRSRAWVDVVWALLNSREFKNRN